MSGPQESDPYWHGAAPQAGPGPQDMRETQFGYGQPLSGASPDQSQQGHEAQAFFPPGGPVGQSYSPLGHFGPPGQQTERKGPWPVVLSVLAVVVVAAAAVGVVGFWKPGYFVTNKLDVTKATSRIQEILTDETNGYGAKNVKDIVCNNGQNVTVRKGGTFTCDVSIDGTKYQLTATFQDNSGTYIVDRPK